MLDEKNKKEFFLTGGDRPIDKIEEDILDRKKLAHQLAKALKSWEEKASLVVGLYGEWGSGKTSVINMMKKYIENIEKKSKQENYSTIIKFNPWLFSDMNNLIQNFFNKIGEKIGSKIARLLKKYARMLQNLPLSDIFNKLSKIVISSLIYIVSLVFNVQLPLAGIFDKLSLEDSSGFFNFIIITIIFILLLIFFQKDKSICEIKRKISKKLEKSKKKIIVIIDDLDRLNQEEIRQIFQLVKINADFPNIIYLLTFYRKVVEKSLEKEQPGFSGKNYLEKIIQVSFNIPVIKEKQINQLLFENLKEIFKTLPEDYQELFDINEIDPLKNNRYSAFYNLFKNIRDIKRFTHGLKFNIPLTHHQDVLEVNPADFAVIEAIRIFLPELYELIKENKSFFTRIPNNSKEKEEKIKEVEEELKKLNLDNVNNTLKLISLLFPNIYFKDPINIMGYDKYTDTDIKEKKLQYLKERRICSDTHFDTYFTFIPLEINRQMQEVRSSIKNIEEFEKILNDYIEKDKKENNDFEKTNKILEIIASYANDDKKIPQKYIGNVLLGLLNISDLIPSYFIKEIEDIISKLFFNRKSNNKEEFINNKNYEILKNAISSYQGKKGVEVLINVIIRFYQSFDDKNKKEKLLLLFFEKFKTNLNLKEEEDKKLFYIFICSLFNIPILVDAQTRYIEFDTDLKSEEMKNTMEEVRENHELYSKFKEIVDLYFEIINK